MESFNVRCKYETERGNARCRHIEKLPRSFCNTIYCNAPTNVSWTFFLIYKRHLIEEKK